MAKRKFDESKVRRDESGRFASAKGIGKQHDLKSVMAGQANKVRNDRVPTRTSLPKSKGVKNDRLPTRPSLPKQRGVSNNRLPTNPRLRTNTLRSTSSSRRTSGELTTNSLKSTSSLRRTGSSR